MNLSKHIILVRGAGDIATGVIQKLHNSGFMVASSEIATPTAIRRTVSLCEAMYTGFQKVEDIKAIKSDTPERALRIMEDGCIPVFEDPECIWTDRIKPIAVIDAILAKKNLGTHRGMAPITIGLGPGFTAGLDVDIAIETKRGHNLGRLIFSGSPEPNTGVPGEIAGESDKRVIYAPANGKIENIASIGDNVKEGSTIAMIEDTPVYASLNGVLRGLIREGLYIKKNLKIADIDPRLDARGHCFTISDKARAIGGAVLEAVLKRLKEER